MVLYFRDPIGFAARGCVCQVPNTPRQFQAWLDCQCECSIKVGYVLKELFREMHRVVDVSGGGPGFVADINEEISIIQVRT